MTSPGIWIGAFLLFYVFDWLRVKSLGKKILRTQKDLYSGLHEYRHVLPREFPRLDFRLYDAAQRTLENLGAISLGDVENCTVSKAFPNMRTAIRRMLDDSKTISISIYQIKGGPFIRLLNLLGVLSLPKLVIDFETEFSDGTFLCTANTLGANTTGEVAGIERRQLPKDTSPENTLAAHRARLRELGTVFPTKAPLHLADLSALTASMHRLQARKNAHKLANGFINEDELKRITGRSDQVVKDLAAAIERAKLGDA